MDRGVIAIGAILALGLLSGCGRGNSNRIRQIPEEHRVLALNAVRGLQHALASGSCDAVLKAGGARLREDWEERCLHIRAIWGEWRSFKANFWYAPAAGQIAVEGVAGFAKGDCTVQVIWDLQSAPPRMTNFFLRSQQESIDFPTLPSRLVDPPTLRGRIAAAS